MYVCICNAITDSQISEAKDSGANSIKDLREHFSICNQCCKCASEIKKILTEGEE